MFYLFVYIVLLSVTNDVAQCTLTQLPEGITLHKGKVAWDEAHEKCQREGKVIASPINAKALSAMKSVIGAHDTTYYIGTKATDVPGHFISIDGVALENMPLAVTLDMVQELDQWEGECLAMSRDSIQSVPCKSRLPYMCYNTHIHNMKRTNCGPDEEGYKYDLATGNCYKLHTYVQGWDVAHSWCASEGAHLAIIEDLKQAQTIKNMLQLANSDYIHVGLRKYYFKYGWISIRGQPVEELYHDWVDSVPQPGVDYQCGALHKSGKLEKFPCGTKFPLVCQREATI